MFWICMYIWVCYMHAIKDFCLYVTIIYMCTASLYNTYTFIFLIPSKRIMIIKQEFICICLKRLLDIMSICYNMLSTSFMKPTICSTTCIIKFIHHLYCKLIISLCALHEYLFIYKILLSCM